MAEKSRASGRKKGAAGKDRSSWSDGGTVGFYCPQGDDCVAVRRRVWLRKEGAYGDKKLEWPPWQGGMMTVDVDGRPGSHISENLKGVGHKAR